MDKNLLLCSNSNCFNIPLINLKNDSQKMDITCNEHNGTYNKTYEISKYLSKNDLKNTFTCSNCSKLLKENAYIFYCKECKKFLCSFCCDKNIFHEHNYVKRTFSNFWGKCIIHSCLYKIYCKTCHTSLCENCEGDIHNNHTMVDINIIKKNENEKQRLSDNLRKQEEAFEIVKKILADCLNKIESELKLKRLILNNYLGNENNGNSIENLNNLYLPTNELFIKYINNPDCIFLKKN